MDRAVEVVVENPCGGLINGLPNGTPINSGPTNGGPGVNPPVVNNVNPHDRTKPQSTPKGL